MLDAAIRTGFESWSTFPSRWARESRRPRRCGSETKCNLRRGNRRNASPGSRPRPNCRWDASCSPPRRGCAYGLDKKILDGRCDADDLVKRNLTACQPRAEIRDTPIGIVDEQMNRVADHYQARDTVGGGQFVANAARFGRHNRHHRALQA